MIRAISAALGVLALAACAPSFNPPPDYQGGFLWDSGQSRTVVVGPEDSVYTIARRYDVPVRVIAARNNLTPPYTLARGQELMIDPIRTHKVADGETLSRIANEYNVPQSLIVEANDIQPPYTIAAGQTLWIPDPFMVAAAEPLGNVPPAPMVVPSRSSPIVASSLPPLPGTTVQPGSPGAPITLPPQEGQPPVVINRPQPDTFTLTNPNPPLSAPMQPATSPPMTPQAAPPPPEPVPPMPLPRPPLVANAPQPDTVAPAPAPQTAMAPPVTQPPAPGTVKFAWPVQGRLVSGFGPAGKGVHNDGINIAAPLGTQIRAVGAGTVVYAGSELKGFGNLLLIKHDNGLTTAYAHADKLLVTKNDVVKQGQVIATVGKSGNVDSPQLHFEVRNGTQAVDPQQYLAR